MRQEEKEQMSNYKSSGKLLVKFEEISSHFGAIETSKSTC